MKPISAFLFLLLPLTSSTLAQTAAPAQRPAPNWGAPAVSPPTAAPGVPAPRAQPDPNAPLPRALQRPELAIVGLCWPASVVGRGCGPILGETAERAQGLMRVPLQSGFHLELGSGGGKPPTAPRGARVGGIAIDPKSCQQVAPIVVTIANVGNATFEPVPGYWPSVGFNMSQGGQAGPNSGSDIKQTLAPGQSVTLRIVDQPLAAGDYDVVLSLHFNDGTGRRRVDYSGRLRVRC
jgi:hypothetical protein